MEGTERLEPSAEVRIRQGQGVVVGRNNTVNIGLAGPVEPNSPPFLPPSRSSPLFGRNAVIGQLRRELLASKPEPTIIRGPPGVGKTCVAIAIAHDDAIRENFKDGILWASAGKQGQGISAGLHNWSLALGLNISDLSTSSVNAWAAQLHAAIGLRSMLIVVDDVWHHSQAEPFLIGGPRCARLVITRNSATALAISPRPAIQIDELPSDAASQLIRHVAGATIAARIDLSLERIVEATGGLPLAMVIAAQYIRRNSAGGDPARLEQSLGVIQDRAKLVDLEGTSPVPGIPTSVRAVVSLSIDDLSGAARALLSILARLPPRPNSISLVSATALGGAPEPLWELCDAGLVEHQGHDSNIRYGLHQSVADYARELSDSAAVEADMLIVRHFVHDSPPLRKDLVAMQADLVNRLTALELAVDRGAYADYISGILAISEVIQDQLPVVEAERYLRRGLRIAERLEDPYAQSQLLQHLADLAHSSDGQWSAEAYARDGLRIAIDAGLRDQQIDHMLRLGTALHLQGLIETALETLRRAHEIATDFGDNNRIGLAAYHLAGAAHTAGDEDEAALRGSEAAHIAQSTNNPLLHAKVSHIMGWIHYVKAEYDEAQLAFERQASLAEQTGSRRTLISASNGTGWLRFVLGNLAGSDQAYSRGLQEARNLHDFSAAALMANLGAVRAARGISDEAVGLFKESIALAERYRQAQYLCLAWLHYGESAAMQGDFTAALEYAGRARSMAEHSGYADLNRQARRVYASALIGLEDFAAGRVEIEALRSQLSSLTHRYEEVQVLRVASLIAEKEALHTEAESHLEKALWLSRQAGFTCEHGLILLALARVRRARGSNSQALSDAKNAAQLLETSGHFKYIEARDFIGTI